MYVLCKCPPPCHFTLSFICTVRICTYIRTLLNLLGSPVASLILSRKCRGFPMSSVGSSTNTSLSTRSEPSCKQGSASTVSWPTSLPLKLVRGRRSWTSICRQRDTHHTLVHTNTHTQDVCATGCPLLHLKSAGMSNYLSTSQSYTDTLAVSVFRAICD